MTELIVALDFPKAEQAMKLIDKLSGLPVIFKVGLELFLGEGPAFVRELAHRKARVFLDLKFHDIPNTVARAARQAASLHVEMFTVHLGGGSAVLRAVANELADIPTLRPKILGVSVLTSFDDVHWAEVTKAMTHHAAAIGDSVVGMAKHAKAWGADGIVCSALELPLLREQHKNLYMVVPGIRLPGSETNDQARVMTPAEARFAGADAIVMGRPITTAADPGKVVQEVLCALSVEPECGE